MTVKELAEKIFEMIKFPGFLGYEALPRNEKKFIGAYMESKEHWEKVYANKAETEVSWPERKPTLNKNKAAMSPLIKTCLATFSKGWLPAGPPEALTHSRTHSIIYRRICKA